MNDDVKVTDEIDELVAQAEKEVKQENMTETKEELKKVVRDIETAKKVVSKLHAKKERIIAELKS